MNRDLLEKPFTPAQIKQRQGEFGDVLDYLEGATVIQRLNEVFASEWSFEITAKDIGETEVVVVAKLTAQGITKMQFGAKTREGTQGDDLKAAATDGLKKCATLFGVGLHLYFDAPKVEPAKANGHERSYVPLPPPALPPVTTTPPVRPNVTERTTGRNLEGRATDKQVNAIFGIGKGQGWSNTYVRQFVQDQFQKQPDDLTKKEASSLIDRLKKAGGQ